MKKNLFLLSVISLAFAITGNCQDVGLVFDGVDDLIQTPGYGCIPGSQARTIDAWIKTPSTANRHPVITQWGVSSAGTKFTFLLYDGGVLRVENGGGNVMGTTNLKDDQWHHVAMVFPGDALMSAAKLYVDGVEEAYTSQAGTAMVNTDTTGVPLTIGKSHVYDVDLRYWKGVIDELRIWDYALTPEELLAVKDSTVCPDREGLVVYYRFSEGEGTIVHDLTPNHHDAVLGGNDEATPYHPQWVEETGAVVLPAVCTPTAVNAFKMDNLEVNIYPNPTSGIVNLTTNINSQAHFKLYNITGQKISDGYFYRDCKIDLMGKQKGVYFIKVDADQVKFVEKIILN
jgi:hypothetical protein